MEAVTQRPAGRRRRGLQPEGTGRSPDPAMALLGVRMPGRAQAGGCTRRHRAARAGTGHRGSKGENRVSNSKQVGLGEGPGGQENKAPDAGLGSRRRRKLLAKTGTGQARGPGTRPCPLSQPLRDPLADRPATAESESLIETTPRHPDALRITIILQFGLVWVCGWNLSLPNPALNPAYL